MRERLGGDPLEKTLPTGPFRGHRASRYRTFIHPAFHPFIHLSIHLPTHPFIYPYIQKKTKQNKTITKYLLCAEQLTDF